MRDTQRDLTQAAAQQPATDPLASSVASAVSDLRRAAGLSERAAARKLGTSQTQLRRMEDPRYLPSLRSLARLATAYGYELRVDFAQKGATTMERRSAASKAKAKTAASRSASPSKARAAAPRRARAGGRSTARRAAPRRRS